MMDQNQERLILDELQALNRSFKAILTIMENLNGLIEEHKEARISPHLRVRKEEHIHPLPPELEAERKHNEILQASNKNALAEVEKLKARIVTCDKGHEYLVSCDYKELGFLPPCTVCSMSALADKLTEAIKKREEERTGK